MVHESLIKSKEIIFNISITQVLLSILAISFLWIILKKYRNIQRNQRPPGPVGLPLVGYLPFLGPEPHKTLWNLKEKYGDIISLYLGNKYTIIINDYNIAKEVLSHPAALDRAQEQFDSLPCIGFQVENGSKWIEQRRFCLSATRDLGLGRKVWEDLITDEVESFTEELSKTEGNPVDISKSLAISVASNIISLLIGRRLNKKEEADKIQLALDFTEVAFAYLGPSEPASLIPGLRKYLEFFKLFGYDKAAEVIKSFGLFVREEIARHKSSSNSDDLQDFINSYLKKIEMMSKTDNVEHFFSEFMLEGNLSILYLGASDTIYSSLTWLMRLMADNMDVQAKVHSEIMDVLGKDGQAKYAERNKIPYTFAVLMEAQRISTIVPISTTRRLNQDISIKGYILPKGAEVVTNLWGIHNDPNYWKEPHRFNPERFLSNNGTILDGNPSQYAPFSMGRRNCPGEKIAWREILGYFTEIIRKFEISLPNGVKADYKIRNGLVTHLKPQLLCFKERK